MPRKLYSVKNRLFACPRDLYVEAINPQWDGIEDTAFGKELELD